MPLHEFFVQLVASIGYALWVRWLMKNTHAPKALCFVPGACAYVAVVRYHWTKANPPTTSAP